MNDTKLVLVTGSTDGIGLATAKLLARQGQRVILHGRNPEKLAAAEARIAALAPGARAGGYLADLAEQDAVEELAERVAEEHPGLDVLVNNAGVFKVSVPRTTDGLDLRFAVNTLAPYLLTKRLLTTLGPEGRVVNLSSAAQAPLDLGALTGGRERLSDNAAYAQSKLGLTMWTHSLARELGQRGPVIVAVNPGSFLGSKMVQEAYGLAGKDLGIGAAILSRAALSEEFASASGLYFDNDAQRFAPPHPDALDERKCRALVERLDSLLTR